MISKTTVSSSSAVSAGWPVMHTHADPSASLLEALFTSNPQQGALSSWFPPSFLSSPPWLCPACGMMLSWPIAQMHGFFGLFSIRQVRDGGPAFPSFQSIPISVGELPASSYAPVSSPLSQMYRSLLDGARSAIALFGYLVAGAVPAQLRAGRRSKALS